MRISCLLLLLLSLLALTGCPDNSPPPGLPEDAFRSEAGDGTPGRTLWQKPGLVIDAMGDLEEKVVADIGAGRGFFSQRLAPLADRVIAIDIDPRFVDYLDTLRQAELPKHLRGRLEPRLARPDDPNLEEEEIDVALIVNTIAFIEDKVAYLSKLMPALRDDGRIVIVDWKKKQTSEGPEQSMRIPLFELEQLLQSAGFRIVSSDDTTLEYQYIVVAEK